jgi:hypothetical protein
VYFEMTETQVEGTTIPEAVAIEGVMPEADVLGGATSGPEGPIAPEISEEVHEGPIRRTREGGSEWELIKFFSKEMETPTR